MWMAQREREQKASEAWAEAGNGRDVSGGASGQREAGVEAATRQ